MVAAVRITRLEHTAAELRGFAAQSSDGAQVRRLLALALVLEGHSRETAAEQSGMDRQTLRDWVHRYNDAGVVGLASIRSGGRTALLTAGEMAELKELVIKGPDPETDKVVRWRCIDLCAVVTRRFAVTVTERTIGKWLRKLELTRLQPRPFHPKKDDAAQAAFKKNFGSLVKIALLASTAAGGKPIEIWYQDEARVGQKGTHAYVWAPVGSCPLMVKDNRHDSAYLFGAICPERGVGAAIIMPTVNTEAMNEHLAEISTQVAAGAHAVVLLDGAGWHQSGGALSVPDNITLLSLPPYAPELNPMELVWEYLRSNKLCAVVWDTYDAILDACRKAWQFLTDDPDRIRSIGTREWASVSG
ncbi:MAG: IS630 family transposase [Bryobacteraceae bacterium]